MRSRSNPTTSFLFMILVFGGVVLAGVLLSNFQREVGVAEASTSSIAAVAAAEDAVRILGKPGEYREYEASMRAATIAHRRIVLFSAVDNDVRLDLGRALDYLELARQAWQAHDAGDWEESDFASSDYLAARLRDPELGSGDVFDIGGVREAMLEGSEPYLDEARKSLGMQQP